MKNLRRECNAKVVTTASSDCLRYTILNYNVIVTNNTVFLN